MQPRIGSLFSGYGGLDLAVEQFFDARTAWHCQYDPEDRHQYAAHVLAQHWTAVPNHGDITAVDFAQVEPVDILTGGFPCQDVSLAGKRAGLTADTRSGLWAHMARAIEELRPQLVVIENTRGLLSARADSSVEPCPWCVGDGEDEPCLRALGAVLADLASLGLDAEWRGVRASDVGAPHERFRVFVLAWPTDPEGPRLEERREGRPARDGAAAADSDHLGAHRPRSRRTGRHEPADHRHPAADADRGLVRHESVAQYRGVSEAVAELARAEAAADAPGLGHGHPGPAGIGGIQAPAVTGGSSASADAGRGGQLQAEPDVQPRESDAGRCAAADTEGVGRGEGGAEPARLGGGSDPAVGSAPDWGHFEPAIRRWEHTTGRPAPRPVDDRGRLSPALPEWMMGLPAGWLTVDPAPAGMTASQIRNAQLKAAGNGVVPQQALAALRLLWDRAAADHPARTAA